MLARSKPRPLHIFMGVRDGRCYERTWTTQLTTPPDERQIGGVDTTSTRSSGTETLCADVDWPAQYTWAYHQYRRGYHGPYNWMGSLAFGMRDASGLHYRRNRFYDAEQGRFTQEDPIGLAGGINLYGYANGDPVSYSDPYGLAACDKLNRSDCSKWELIALGVADRVAPVAPALNLAFEVLMFASPDPAGEIMLGAAVLGRVGKVGELMVNMRRGDSLVDPVTKNLKTDGQHAFSVIVDNYADDAAFSIPTRGVGGKIERYSELRQIGGSLNGKDGVFEWIVDQGRVTHRRFIPRGYCDGNSEPSGEIVMRECSPYDLRYRIACDKGFVTWGFLRVGYERRLIGPDQVIVHAVQAVAQSVRAPDSVLELAGADSYSENEVENLLRTISPGEATERDIDRWRLCVLVQVRMCWSENPNKLLEAVADAYSIFDYPADMKRAVHYMPVEGSMDASLGEVFESPVSALDDVIGDLDSQLARAGP